MKTILKITASKYVEAIRKTVAGLEVLEFSNIRENFMQAVEQSAKEQGRDSLKVMSEAMDYVTSLHKSY